MDTIEDKFELKPQNVKSLRDIALESLRDAIVSGYFKPGQHLKERELSTALGISTTPIKEALRILDHEGLVETIPRKGTFVSELVNTSIEEMLMLKAYLEGLSASLASIKVTSEDLENIELQINLMEKLTKNKDLNSLAEENKKFHILIREAAKNPMIYQILSNITTYDDAFRKRALQHNLEIEEGFNEHKSIFEAIKNRDPETAEKRMKDHIMRTARSVLKDLKQNK